MKKFFIKLLLLLLPIVSLLLFFEYKLSTINNIYNVKIKSFAQKMSECQVLVLGDSHALYGINPFYFRRPAFNMANVSQTLFLDYKIVEKFSRRMPQLKVVIWPISYFSLDTKDYPESEYWRVFSYERFYKIKFPGNYLFDVRRYSLIYLYGNVNAFFWSLHGFDVDFSNGLDERGFMQGGDIKDPADKKLALERVQYHHRIMNSNNREGNWAHCEELIQKLQAQGVQVVLVTLPVYHTYSDQIDLLRYQSMQLAIGRLSQKYHVKYLNYFYDKRFILEDFKDCDHLNTLGAQKFTSILDKDLGL